MTLLEGILFDLDFTPSEEIPNAYDFRVSIQGRCSPEQIMKIKEACRNTGNVVIREFNGPASTFGLKISMGVGE